MEFEQTSFDPAQVAKDAKAILSLVEYNKVYRADDYMRWYKWQKKIVNSTARETLLVAANQVGKSLVAAKLACIHATGEYPDWYTGRRFDGPVEVLVASETTTLTRDVNQKLMFGEPGISTALGSGVFPLSSIEGRPVLGHGIGGGCYDTVAIKHRSGKLSKIYFRSYASGRESFQGLSLHLVIFDESPPMQVYSEALTRTTARNGLCYVVFTPSLPGADHQVIHRFAEEESPERTMINVSLYDCAPPIEPDGHWTIAQIEERIRNCPPHERDARIYGKPTQGSGAVFPIAEIELLEPRRRRDDIPQFWKAIWGIDFGIGHPFAAVLVLHDPELDEIHVQSCIRMTDATPLQHAASMKAIGANVPVAYPHDGDHREFGSGEALVLAYKRQGLRILSGSARNPSRDGKHNFATEPAIQNMWSYMERRAFKIASDLTDWRSEFRSYHRDEHGLLVRVRDDLMSATRIACMSLRFARPLADCPLGSTLIRQGSNIATNIDFDVFSGRPYGHGGGGPDDFGF
jgi:phage terminase large subunit-like protein